MQLLPPMRVAWRCTHFARAMVPFDTTLRPLPSNFSQGQTGATYAVTVSNAVGAGPTTGTVTVTETVPAGMTLVSMAGTGWACPSNACTRSDALAAGASYPTITVTVNVSLTATTPLLNAVGVSGGGSAPANATDSTIRRAVQLHLPTLRHRRLLILLRHWNSRHRDHVRLRLDGRHHRDVSSHQLTGRCCQRFSNGRCLLGGLCCRSFSARAAFVLSSLGRAFARNTPSPCRGRYVALSVAICLAAGSCPRGRQPRLLDSRRESSASRTSSVPPLSALCDSARPPPIRTVARSLG